MATTEFDAVVVGDDGPGCGFALPFDPKEAYGRARAPVRVSVDGAPAFRTTVASYGGTGWIGLRKAQRADPAALLAYEAMSFSHRKEYADWVAEGRKQQTRDDRAATGLAASRRGSGGPHQRTSSRATPAVAIRYACGVRSGGRAARTRRASTAKPAAASSSATWSGGSR